MKGKFTQIKTQRNCTGMNREVQKSVVVTSVHQNLVCHQENTLQIKNKRKHHEVK